MESPRLRKGPSKGGNYVGVSEELVETKTELIHTANAYEKNNWDDHYREPASPYNVGSPNDNGITQDGLKKRPFSFVG
jgi:putative lipase involved disintegration of autophagic bodies